MTGRFAWVGWLAAVAAIAAFGVFMGYLWSIKAGYDDNETTVKADRMPFLFTFALAYAALALSRLRSDDARPIAALTGLTIVAALAVATTLQCGDRRRHGQCDVLPHRRGDRRPLGTRHGPDPAASEPAPAGVNVLGIHDGEEAGVALVIDGRVVFAANEERYSRQKMHFGFPFLALQKLFHYTGIEPADIDHVGVGFEAMVGRPGRGLRLRGRAAAAPQGLLGADAHLRRRDGHEAGDLRLAPGAEAPQPQQGRAEGETSTTPVSRRRSSSSTTTSRTRPPPTTRRGATRR